MMSGNNDLSPTPAFNDPVMKVEYGADGKARAHRWLLPTTADTVSSTFIDIFTRYWDRLIFGPILDGIAYEWTCPYAPDRFDRSDGYLTIGFNGPHFHMYVGKDGAQDGSAFDRPKLREASMFRLLDKSGAPTSWGYELKNGSAQPIMSIWFDNPFLTGPDQLAETPDWSRLAMWRDLSWRYLGLSADPFDETSVGFGKPA